MDISLHFTVILSVEILVCVLGCVGNISSFLVLIRHRNDIPASRILVGLTAADTGLLLSLIANAIVGIVGFQGIIPHGAALLHTKDVYEFFYICSIYMTVVVSVDRYLVTSRPLMMRRLNHKALQWRVQLVVAIISVFMVLPETVSPYVDMERCTQHVINPDTDYVHSSITEKLCQHTGFLEPPELTYVNRGFPKNRCLVCYSRLNVETDNTKHFFHNGPCNSHQCATPDDFRILAPLLSFFCNNVKRVYPAAGTTGNHTLLERGNVEMCYHYNITGNDQHWDINVLEEPSKYTLRDNREYQRSYSLGVVFPFRYAIPVLCLIFTSVSLVRAVRKATRNQRSLATHSAVNRRMLASTNMLKIVLTVTGMFILSHTLGLGCYLGTIIYSFGSEYGINATVYVLCPIGGLVTAINSSVNVVVYCFFLKQFRDRWIKLWKPRPRSATDDGLPMSSVVTATSGLDSISAANTPTIVQ